MIKLLKKNDILIYSQYTSIDPHTKKHWVHPDWTDKELRVVCKERWGDVLMAKCKVLEKGWYKEIYLSDDDFAPNYYTGLPRARWKN